MRDKEREKFERWGIRERKRAIKKNRYIKKGEEESM